MDKIHITINCLKLFTGQDVYDGSIIKLHKQYYLVVINKDPKSTAPIYFTNQ